MERVNANMDLSAMDSCAILPEIRADPTLVKMAENVIRDMVESYLNACAQKDLLVPNVKSPRVPAFQIRV